MGNEQWIIVRGPSTCGVAIPFNGTIEQAEKYQEALTRKHPQEAFQGPFELADWFSLHAKQANLTSRIMELARQLVDPDTTSLGAEVLVMKIVAACENKTTPEPPLTGNGPCGRD